ncbi:lysis system i-spanin subunit Rz [Variovorax sp. LjRoot84]|uniref:lysis system i-spanin subunit Rz n=1 Tax=Variovorax sp. LjRoot84 TaxID=3342340 RepID=UPI003ECC8362
MTWLLKALPFLAAVALGVTWTAVAYQFGGAAREDAVRLEWQTERTANARAVANAIERTLDAQRSLGDVLAARDQQHRKEIEHVTSERDRLAEQLRTGTVRVSVPALARSRACPAAGAADPAPAGAAGEARAELDPAFATAVARITSDGDRSIVDLNACIDRYNDVRARSNALTSPTWTDDAQAP